MIGTGVCLLVSAASRREFQQHLFNSYSGAEDVCLSDALHCGRPFGFLSSEAARGLVPSALCWDPHTRIRGKGPGFPRQAFPLPSLSSRQVFK